MSWTFDPSSRRYREEESGRTLSERELRPLRERFLRQVTDRTLVVTGQLANRQITLEEWEIEMRRVVKDAFGTAYMLSRGGRNAMTQEDWGRIGGLVGRQYRYLNQYAQDIGRQTVTRDKALSRSVLYVQAATQSYQRGQLASYGSDMPRLERVPGDGSTTCLVNCLPGDQLVRARQVRGGYRRWYDGELVTLTTSNQRLSVSSNHPVLTRRGWIAAGQLRVGDDLVRDGFAQRMADGQPDVHDMPTPIAQIVRALEQRGQTQRVMGIAMDFHGDGAHGEIDVVRAHGQLRFHLEPARLHPFEELVLGRFGQDLTARRASARNARPMRLRLPLTAHGGVSSVGAGLSRLGRHGSHAHPIGLADPASLNARAHEYVPNGVAIHAEDAGQRELALAIAVASGDLRPRKVTGQSAARATGWLADLFDQALAERADAAPQLARDFRERLAASDAFDELLVVDRQAFHGYVYNLETESGLYGAGSVVVRNCRCELDITETDDGWDVFWLDLGDERECQDCRQQAASWSPLQLARPRQATVEE